MLSINYQCTLCHVCVTQYIFCNSPVDEDTRKGGCTLAGVAGLGLDDSGLIWSNSMATPSRDTTSGVFIILEKVVLNKPFLAHQSTKCSGWAIVTGFCPSSINIFSSSEHKVLKVSYCVRSLSFVKQACVNFFNSNNFFSETTYWILTKLGTNDSWVVLY